MATNNLPDPLGRNADRRYYSSGQVSAIQQSRVDSGKGTTIGVPNFRADDRSTNKYYKEGGTGGQQVLPGDVNTERQRRKKTQTARNVPREESNQPTTSARGAGKLVITKAEDVNPVCEAVIALLDSAAIGEVKVHITDSAGLPMRVRTYLDLAVTRERITEAQYRDVVLVVQRSPDTVVETRQPDEIFGDPSTAQATIISESEEEIGDVGDFFAGAEETAEETPAAPDVSEVVNVQDGNTGELIQQLTHDERVAQAQGREVQSVAATEVGSVEELLGFDRMPDEARVLFEKTKEQPGQPAAGVPSQPKKNKRR